jgi:hypothetical protein
LTRALSSPKMGGVPLTRKQPLRRKSPKKRRYRTPRCIGVAGKGRCKKAQEHLERCTPHAKQYLDGLVRKATASETCELDHDALGINCVGELQVLHGLDRDELGVRWDLRNVFRGCSGANAWGHVHKRRWYAYVQRIRGVDVYADLCRIADEHSSGAVKVDYEAVERVLLASLAPTPEGVAHKNNVGASLHVEAARPTEERG